MRKINFVFLAGMLVVLVLFSGATWGFHEFQIGRNAKVLLEQSRKAEAGGSLSEVEKALSLYLNLKTTDSEAWKSYVLVIDRLQAGNPPPESLYLRYEDALRYNPGDAELERRCIELALETDRANQARNHIDALLTAIKKDVEEKKKSPEDARQEQARLEEQGGQANYKGAKYQQAADDFASAIEHDPTLISIYPQLARALRTELTKDDRKADEVIDRMIKYNPKVGTAYLSRFLYKDLFHPPADPEDIKMALQLAPENPEILFAAARVAARAKDVAATRVYLEKGLILDPKNLDIAVNLAELEKETRHPERAVAVLRDFVRLSAHPWAVYSLASTLIELGKPEQAVEPMAMLRGRGLLRASVARVLDAKKFMLDRKWREAIRELEGAQADLKALPEISERLRLDLLLAECQGNAGLEEQRVASLRHAVSSGVGDNASKLQLAGSLARSGNLEEALKVLEPMADRSPEFLIELLPIMIERMLRLPKEARDWPLVEARFRRADKELEKRPEFGPALTLLRAELLSAQDRRPQARDELTRASAKDPKNLRYRLALAALAQIEEPKGAAALRILDTAEKELGASVGVSIARIDYWSRRGGDQAKAELAKLAELRKGLKAEELPVYLDRLGQAMLRLVDTAEAKKYWSELAKAAPKNLQVLASLFQLALESGDQAEAEELIGKIKESEAEQGTQWRYARAYFLIDRHRKAGAREPNAPTSDLAEARDLAEQIAGLRPQWWGSYLLEAQIAELKMDLKEAVEGYNKALERGNARPGVVKRLVTLLAQMNRNEELDRLVESLKNRPDAPPEVKLATLDKAMRKGDYRQALELAGEIFPERSLRHTDHIELGRAYYSIPGRLEDAGKEFRRAVELGAGSPDAWLAYVQFLVRTQKLDEARSTVKAARLALPAKTAAIPLAQCCLLVGESKEAEALIQAALKEKPSDPAALRMAAGFYFAIGKTDEVGKYLDMLTAPDSAPSPEDVALANRLRAECLLRTGRIADRGRALNLVNENLEGKTKDSESAADLSLKAMIAAMRPDTADDAIGLLKRLDDEGRLGPDDRFRLAQLFLRKGQEKEFRDEMLRLLVRNGNQSPNPRYLVSYTNHLIKKGELDQAERWLVELRKVDSQGLATLEIQASLLKARNPERPDPRLRDLLEGFGRQHPDQIGFVADLLGRYGFDDQAEEAYKAFIERDRSKPERELALAQFLAGRQKQNRTSEAMAILERAWKISPPELVALAALPLYDAPSVSGAQRKQVEAWLAEASKKRPDLVVLSNKLAAIWIRQGRFEEAKAMYSQLLENNPENAEALNNLAWILALWDQSESRKDLGEALNYIDRAIHLQGGIPSLPDTKAVILIRANRLEEAIDTLEHAGLLDGHNADVPVHMALALLAKNRPNDARRSFEEAVKLGWRAEKSDPLERTLIDKLRLELGL
jgi:tetratricopeptide (TPR) repeat protein